MSSGKNKAKKNKESFQYLHWDESTEYDLYGDAVW